eukprot:TRINITY_DN5911_c0_g1_i11.p1 TRINITY_DN5911_c0_g1~~TRINITY_DN5911_c0_g1_i11.p1  ORF type:complete len:764 (-),score=131.61 TRINITY_DN5911_c0_g1_i11:854-2806(-)
MYERMNTQEMESSHYLQSRVIGISSCEFPRMELQEYDQPQSSNDPTFTDISLLDDDEEELVESAQHQYQSKGTQDKTPWRLRLAKAQRSSSSEASVSSPFMKFFNRKERNSELKQGEDSIHVGRSREGLDDSLTSQASVSDLLSSSSPYLQQDIQQEDSGVKQQDLESEEVVVPKKLSFWKSFSSKFQQITNGSVSREGSQREGRKSRQGQIDQEEQAQQQEAEDESQPKTPADAAKVEEMQLEMALAESKRLHRGMASIDDADLKDPEGAYVDAGVRLQEEGWWRKRISTRANEHSIALDVDVCYAKFDQRSSQAEGYAACACMSVVLAEWLLQNPGKLPIQQGQMEQLLLTGARDWQLIQQSLGEDAGASSRQSNDGHIYLETALEQLGRQASLVVDGQYVVFLRPFEGSNVKLDCPPLEEYLSSTPSLSEIWKEMEQRAPCVFIVAWNEHFALLEFMEDGRVFFVDTLGERLHEGCDRAYILRFPCTEVQHLPEELLPMRRIQSEPNISLPPPPTNPSPTSSGDFKHRRLESIEEHRDLVLEQSQRQQINTTKPISLKDVGRKTSLPTQMNHVEPTLLTPNGGSEQCQAFLQYVYTHTPVFELGARYEAARKRGVAPLDWFLDCQQVILKTLQMEFRQLQVVNTKQF